MAFRLYRTTRRLYGQVEEALRRLQVWPLLQDQPTLCGLVALYVTGLLLLDARPTQPRISEWLPARSHDVLNRLPRTMPWSTRTLMRRLIVFAAGLSQRLGRPGYLMVDDV